MRRKMLNWTSNCRALVYISTSKRPAGGYPILCFPHGGFQKHIRAIISLRWWMILSRANRDEVFGTHGGLIAFLFAAATTAIIILIAMVGSRPSHRFQCREHAGLGHRRFANA
jgi:hypothetical protein